MIKSGDKSTLLINGAIAIIVTGAFAFWAMSLSDLGHVADDLASSSLNGWFLCCGFMVLVTACRYLRVQLCVPSAPPLSLYRASALHGAAISVLPGKLGEAVLPVALKQLAGIPLMSGAGLLLLIRAFDTAALATLATIAYWLSGVAEPGMSGLVKVAAFVALVLLGSAPLVVVHGIRFLPRGDHFIGRMVDSITAAIQIIPLSRIYLILLMTVMIWIFLGLAAFASIEAVGLEATLVNGMLAVALGSFAFALPINGIASIGPFEAAFSFALGLFGMPLDAAIAAAVHLHVCAVGTALVAAIAGQIAVMAKVTFAGSVGTNQ